VTVLPADVSGPIGITALLNGASVAHVGDLPCAGWAAAPGWAAGTRPPAHGAEVRFGVPCAVWRVVLELEAAGGDATVELEAGADELTEALPTA
jgi:hypothetical protein